MLLKLDTFNKGITEESIMARAHMNHFIKIEVKFLLPLSLFLEPVFTQGKKGTTVKNANNVLQRTILGNKNKIITMYSNKLFIQFKYMCTYKSARLTHLKYNCNTDFPIVLNYFL